MKAINLSSINNICDFVTDISTLVVSEIMKYYLQ